MPHLWFLHNSCIFLVISISTNQWERQATEKPDLVHFVLKTALKNISREKRVKMIGKNEIWGFCKFKLVMSFLCLLERIIGFNLMFGVQRPATRFGVMSSFER